MDTPKERDIVSRMKSKYFKLVKVLMNKKATQAYGKAGKNGVIKIKLNVPKKVAFNDLLAHAPDSSGWVSQHNGNIYVSLGNGEGPHLKGGFASFQNHVKYPASCKDAGIQGEVIVQFVVNKQGIPTNVHVVRGIGGGCDQAAIQAVKNYARFTPGMINGKPVKVRMSLPVVFKLPDSPGS